MIPLEVGRAPKLESGRSDSFCASGFRSLENGINKIQILLRIQISANKQILWKITSPKAQNRLKIMVKCFKNVEFWIRTWDLDPKRDPDPTFWIPNGQKDPDS